MATKPIGLSNRSSAGTTPISPSGATVKTRNIRPKLCSWIISSVAMVSSITGTTCAMGPCPLADSSTAPPVARV